MKVPAPPPWPVLVALVLLGVLYYTWRGFWRWITAPRHWEFAYFTIRYWVREWRVKP